MITVTCPDCTETRQLRNATTPVALCRTCTQQRRWRRLQLAKRREPTSALPGILHRVAALVDTLRRCDTLSLNVPVMHRELDALEHIVTVLCDQAQVNLLARHAPAAPAADDAQDTPEAVAS